MKRMKKLMSASLAAALSLSAVLLPAKAAEVSYPEASSTDPAAWYLYGDVDQNGTVNSMDARTVLRTAAYIERPLAPESIAYGAADYDRDGVISSRDARLILRNAAKLDQPAAQPAHPYASKTTLTAEEALTFLRQANILKTPEGRTAYTIKETVDANARYIKKEMTGLTDALASLGAMSEDELFDSLLADLQTGAESFEREVTPFGIYTEYNQNLQLKGDPSVVISDSLPAGTVKSAAMSYDKAANTYTVKVTFKDETVTLNTSDSALLGVNSDIPKASDMAMLGDLQGMEGTEIAMEAAFMKNAFDLGRSERYTMSNKLTNITVSYTFNAVTNKPVSALYTLNADAVIPATISMKLENLGLGTIRFAVNATQKVTTAYDFHG